MTSFISICLGKKKQMSCNSSVAAQSFDNTDVYLMGRFYNQDGKISSQQDIYNLYAKYGSKLYDHLDGTGTAIIIDHKRSKLYAFTDYFNSTLPLFYAATKDELLLSTDMLFITRRIKNLSISKNKARQFMLHGMVFGKRTLIKQIKKLSAKHYVEVSLKHCKLHLKKCKYTIKKIPGITPSMYDQTFSKCMQECYQSNTGLTLSGGFDTNYLLHHLQKIKTEMKDSIPIKAFCGGGLTGRDETPLAQAIAQHYGNIDLKTFHVGPESIQNFPEIVFALQGVCFEDGVFLHYKLAKMFKEENIKFAYTGDLADQVLNLETYQYTKSTYKRIAKMTLQGIKHAIFDRKYDFYKWMFRGRYETAALKLLKKSGQMWDYFGTQGIYPFARRAFLCAAKSTSKPGDYSKTFHRKIVLQILDSQLAKKIKRNGGNTDPKALFDVETKGILRDIIRQFPWYKKRTFTDEDQQLGYELRILYIDLVRRIFINKELNAADSETFPLLQEFYPEFGL